MFFIIFRGYDSRLVIEAICMYINEHSTNKNRLTVIPINMERYMSIIVATILPIIPLVYPLLPIIPDSLTDHIANDFKLVGELYVR